MLLTLQTKNVQKAFTDIIAKINSHIELEGLAKIYYFADSMAILSEFCLSFKDMLPCYNLISDLREYSLYKKVIKNISEQIETMVDSIVVAEKAKALKQFEVYYNEQVLLLKKSFNEQREILNEKLCDSDNTYVASSYA